MGDRSTLPLPQSTYSLEIVLIGVSHPGNLGAVCRSMLNYGFTNLRLVNPRCEPDNIEARNRAKHAGRVLDQCITCLLYTSPSPRDLSTSRMPSSA